MRRNKIISVLSLPALVVLAVSCVKYRLSDTLHPDAGSVYVSFDWSGIGEGLDIPPEWTLNVGDRSYGLGGENVTFNDYFPPGTYRISAYNRPENIWMDGSVATAVHVSGGDDAAEYITGSPGWLFSSVMDLEVEADREYEVVLDMVQQVRQLTIVLEFEGGTAPQVSAVKCSLSGAAGTLDLVTGEHGTPSSVMADFSKITEGDDAGKWSCTVRLLGISGEPCKLAGTIFFDSGPDPMPLEGDLSEYLSGFNTGKEVPLVLKGLVKEVPTGAGFSGIVDGWESVEGGNVDAH